MADGSFEQNVVSASVGDTGTPTGEHETTTGAETQTANANLENANIDEGKKPDWIGDLRYFQSGKKAGQLKPSAAVSGVDATKAASTEFDGLNVGALNATNKKKPEPQAEEKPAKLLKAEKKANEARIGAAMAMRLLDVLVGYISGGEYGKNFTEQQRQERNKYRDDLNRDWEAYLLTLDIPMHPGLVVAFASTMYVADAFNTPKGEAKAASLKQKVIGGLIGRFFK